MYFISLHRSMKLLILQILLSISLCSPSSVQLLFSNGTVNVYSSGSLSQNFTNTASTLNCVEAQTYILQQTSTQLQSNSPYTIQIITSSLTTIHLSTKYNNFVPTYQPSQCFGNCNVTVWNNCNQNSTSDNYFDFITLQVTGMPDAYYRVWCNQNYKPTTFQWGLFILILLITVIIWLSALYSRAWSIGGRGIKINYWIVLALNLLWIVGSLIGAFAEGPAYIIVLVLSWLFGIVCVAFCCNETLWLFKSDKINKPFFWLVRPIDVISLCVGIGVVISWWLTDMNWISSNIIGICTIVAFIKCFKFTSMQMATLLLSTILVIEVIVALIIYYVMHQSYNNLMLNQFNNPMFLQLPTINKELNQRCAWIPVTEVIFPGIFLSYLRRFDDSRNTRVFQIVGCASFCIGSLLWMTMTIFNIHAWPFALFSQTLLLSIVALIATNRNQIRTIWNGKFYDAEFADIYESDQLKKSFNGDQRQIQMRQSIFEGMRASSSRQTASLANSLPNQARPGNVI